MLKKLLLILLLTGIVFATTSDNYVPIEYNCDGGTTEFTFDWPIEATSDVEVILKLTSTEDETVLTEYTHYDVSATNNDYTDGGTITTVAIYANTYTLIIRRDTPKTQVSVFEDTRTIRIAAIESGQDKLTRLVQDLYEIIGRCIKILKTETSNVELVSISNRADKNITFDAVTGDVSVTSVLSTGTANVSAWGETLVNDGSAAEARGTLDIDIDDDVEFTEIIGTTITGTIGTFDNIITKGPWIDITHPDYGGVGDNSTDNTAALQAAHDALPSWGGTIYFPGGSVGYRFDGTVAFTKGNIKLTSDFFAPAYIRSYTTDPLWTFTGPSYAGRISYPMIENLLFVPHLVNCGHALQFTYVERPFLEHVYISNGAAESAQNIDDITLAGTDPVSIELTGHGYATGEAIWFASVGGTTELNNNLYVITKTNNDNFTLDSTDSSDYTVFTTGGTATQYNTFNDGFNFTDCNFGRCIDIRASRCRNIGFVWQNNVNHADNNGFNLYIDDSFFTDNANIGAYLANVRLPRIQNTGFNRNTFDGLRCFGEQDLLANPADGLVLQNNEYDANGGIGLYLWKRLWVWQSNEWLGSGRIENVSSAYYRECEALNISNINAFYSGLHGLHFDTCNDVKLTNINSTNNEDSGLLFESCSRVLGNNLNLSQRTYDGQAGGYAQEYGLYTTGCDFVELSGVHAIGNNTENIRTEAGEAVVINGHIKVDGSDKATSGTGEDNLNTVIVPTDYHNYHRGIKIKAVGTISGTNNTKIIKLHFGSTSWTVVSAASGDVTDWQIEAEIFFTAAATQRIVWKALESDGTILSGYETATEDLGSGDITCKLTGECANASDTITQTIWTVKIIPLTDI